MRKFIKKCFLFIIVFFFIITSVGNKPPLYSVEPTGDSYRHYIKVRSFFESHGGTVTWDEKSNTAVIEYSSHLTKLRKDSQSAIVDNRIILLENSPRIINERMLIAPSGLSKILEYVESKTQEDRTEYLWNNTVALHLKDNLWTDRYIYDAGHYLMVPLHAAFFLDNNEWQKQFSDHFRSFMNDKNNISEGRLNQLHYYYLISRFLVLADEGGKSVLIPEGIADFLYDKIIDIWLNKPAWQWEHSDFKGIKERIQWKLNNTEPKRSYYRAIIDEELFTFAIAADLFKYYEEKDRAKQTKLEDILDAAYEVFHQEIEYEHNGGWLFQPGVWAEHPDYAYAGNEHKAIGMQKEILYDIAMDTSHSHRFPLWLTSLSQAYPDGSVRQKHYQDLLYGLYKQFTSVALVNPTETVPGYRTTNFMDGRNGVYRWNYVTQGTNNGYGPYELSGTLSLGWWTFLGEEQIKQVYREMSNQFPLSDDIIKIYIGPGTTRERHPLTSGSNIYVNGYAELISILASEI